MAVRRIVLTAEQDKWVGAFARVPCGTAAVNTEKARFLVKTGHWNFLGRLTLQADATSANSMSQKTYEVAFSAFCVYTESALSQKKRLRHSF